MTMLNNVFNVTLSHLRVKLGCKSYARFFFSLEKWSAGGRACRPRGSYGVCVVVTVSTWLLLGQRDAYW